MAELRRKNSRMGRAARIKDIDSQKVVGPVDQPDEVHTQIRLCDDAVWRPATVYERYGKRSLDLVGALFLLVLLAPILLILSLCVMAALGRPILYSQVRVCRHGRTFTMLKFRSMNRDRRVAKMPFDCPDRRICHKTLDDPRHTSLGRTLRKLSLDELPQLWNVVKGEMSLVGPRPEVLAISEEHGLMDHPRHTVRPGITGPWQVSKNRPGLVHENVHLDVRYVEHVSLLRDLKIILQAVAVLAHPSGE